MLNIPLNKFKHIRYDNFNEKNYFEFIFRKHVNDFEESQRVEKIEDAIDHSGWNVFGNVGIQIK